MMKLILKVRCLWNRLKAILQRHNRMAIIFLIGSFSLICSCEKADLSQAKPNENLRPAADFLKNNYEFKIMYAAFEHAGMVEELNSEGPLTVLAVSDEGFRLNGIQSVQQIKKMNKDSVKMMMAYHVLKNRRLLSTDIPTNAVDSRYETLGGDAIYTSAVNSLKRFYFDGAGTIRTDVQLSNGVMHVLNKMMKFQKNTKVQEFIARNPNYSIFVAGLKKFKLWDELAKDGLYTVFVPNNKTFEDNGITLETVANWKAESYHNRLFNSYIMYGKHYFISDKYIFLHVASENYYNYTIKDDTWYLRFSQNENRGNNAIYPVIDLMKTVPGRPFPDLIKNSSFNSNNSNSADFDYRLEDGIVHEVNQLFVLPSQAILTN